MIENKELLPFVNPIEEYRKIIKDKVQEFLASKGLDAILGFSGGADDIGEEKTYQLITEIILNVRDLKVAILTGGTKGGIPEIALKIARSSSMPTVGVFPPEGRKYALLDSLDLEIETIPPTYGPAIFGTETPTFCQLANGVTVIGGGFGTLTEVATILKMNPSRVRRGLPAIQVCPIEGTGGVADLIKTLPGIQKVSFCLPNSPVRTGIEVASFFKKSLAPHT